VKYRHRIDEAQFVPHVDCRRVSNKLHHHDSLVSES
jgi:hypothetical protein